MARLSHGILILLAVFSSTQNQLINGAPPPLSNLTVRMQGPNVSVAWDLPQQLRTKCNNQTYKVRVKVSRRNCSDSHLFPLCAKPLILMKKDFPCLKPGQIHDFEAWVEARGFRSKEINTSLKLEAPPPFLNLTVRMKGSNVSVAWNLPQQLRKKCNNQTYKVRVNISGGNCSYWVLFPLCKTSATLPSKAVQCLKRNESYDIWARVEVAPPPLSSLTVRMKGSNVSVAWDLPQQLRTKCNNQTYKVRVKVSGGNCSYWVLFPLCKTSATLPYKAVQCLKRNESYDIWARVEVGKSHSEILRYSHKPRDLGQAAYDPLISILVIGCLILGVCLVRKCN